jgi:hypothetical protein
MFDHVYKQVELTGSSTSSIEDAVETALSGASGKFVSISEPAPSAERPQVSHHLRAAT